MFLFFHDSICAMCTFSSSTNNFAHVQTLLRMSSLSGRMNIVRINIEFFTGCKKIKQQRISFVLGYLRMILWKISTAISIKHQILATFNMKKKFNMYLEEGIFFFFFYFFTIHSHIWSSAFQILAFDHAYHFYMPLCYYRILPVYYI